MKQSKIYLVILLFASVWLTACSKPKTPQEVSKAFWYAVIENKVDDVVTYSTLASNDEYDAFSRTWTGMIPSWGKVIIDETESRVHTHVSSPDAAQSEMLYFVTYLTRQGEEWKVDYTKTARVVRASSAVTDFVNRITTMGNDISQQLDEAGEELSLQMEIVGDELSQQLEDAGDTLNNEMLLMNEQLMAFSDSLDEQAERAIEEYSQLLQQHMKSLADSINNAISEQGDSVTPGDRQKMEQSIEDLNRSSSQLLQPDMKSIVESGEVIVITRENLTSVDDATFSQYQDQWQSWIEKARTDLHNLLDDLSGKPAQ